MNTLREFLNFELIKLKAYTLTVADVCSAVLIILIAWTFLYVLKRFVLRVFFSRRHVTVGHQYAVTQLIKYIIYPITILLSLQALGIQLSVVLAGAAALLVGIGLGLQQTFKDLLSGIVLLVEGTVRVGDMVVIDDTIVMVKDIGLRTSTVETRDDIVKIVPNSKLVEETVINWSHNNRPTRFHVDVGVAYGSDLTLVRNLLLKAAGEHPKVLQTPETTIQFREFGASSLDFKLFFYSYEFLRIEVVKSDLRFRIDELFRQHDVTIPFPQQEVWFRNELTSALPKGHENV
ncbi:Potassium efflux system kefA Short=Protein aefA [Fibrisoma limi BUZ 3]|uniref:Potassium efflux system kefA Short=Protein aefA n=1 Tax=Fibrisoma limi BUZ 3 TaxID=1185876 RepID=I2GPX1_9BACT|nr:mechanosensitive ion channel domain-containing protein [Fibrisoma limi]CCH55949.1 Potassium efflux system kefA Short=Protein aefA [Fibrisoma limi BUZ 3]